MKKFLIAFSIFVVWTLWVDAVSYNWSATFSLPTATTSTGEQVLFPQYTPAWGSFPYLSAYSSGSWLQTFQSTFGFQVNSSTNFSGEILDISYCGIGGGWCGSGWNEFYQRFYYNSWARTFYTNFDSDTTTGSQLSYAWEFDSTELPNCIWLSSDCLVVFVTDFKVSILWAYVDAIHMFYYYKPDYSYTLVETLDDVLIDPSFTQMTNTSSLINNLGTTSSGWLKAFNYYKPVSSAYIKNMDMMPSYLAYYTGMTLSTGSVYPFTYSLPKFLNSQGWTIWQLPWASGSIFDECNSFLDVWCYIGAIWNAIESFITDNLFPDISFSGDFNSCGSWSKSSGTYMQKLWNLIAIINPIPPQNNTVVCTPFWSGAIKYQGLIWSWWLNFFSVYWWWLTPSYLNWTGMIYGWQSVIDLVIIFVCFVLIFYHRKND